MSFDVNINVLVLAPRLLTVELAGCGGRDRLDKPLRWQLFSEGMIAQDGLTERPVVTLEGLVPGIGYQLAVERMGNIDFVTPPETGLVDIRDHGAIESAADNGSAFAAAISAAPEGATLYVPPGIWRTGPVFLKSGLFVHVPEGATIKGVADRGAYRMLEAFGADGRQQASWEGVPARCYGSLLTAIDADGVTIAGKGVIDGAGAEGDWWEWPKETREGARRPRTVFANRCTQLKMSGLTVRNSPSWTIHPLDCAGAVFADLAIENPPDSPNTDGLNPESSTDIEIVGVRFSVGDDCIAIKAGKIWPDGTVPAPTRNVSVRHCLMERGHGGVVIGSEMSGSVTDVTVAFCTMRDTDRGLRIKTRRGRGGAVARIVLSDCLMDGVKTPLSINSHYFCDPDGRSDAVQNRAPAPVSAATPKIGDIRFERTEVKNAHHALAYVLGLAEAPVSGLTIADVSVTYAPEAVADVPDMALGLPSLRHGGIITENVLYPQIAGITGTTQTDTIRERA
ncbi:glycoside hydrolase family 28 protein [Pelagibacterium halotolerans]|uniref:Polygalacturonase n=1 Tax=Pelagibacterium halotolerans (strain DSM 22347 / JCM 15775 / CGMCC 1.7692 / B2) TaxID=1082931 RepID=G4RFK4_PELHB|nr:glycoside hydrolase family 28 protein [Pelagibacterium halotolerans]AEQ53006.1 Polygalacturonase [Pelagibacterium halotolerans B2]QJR17336.1 glycoside hydrolase family 28 protein [Pelagibacterium halotolerans]SEA97810.1 Polygalacturonase [Pelagibacterium halotolerans]